MLHFAKMDGDTGAMQLSYMSGSMDRSFGSRYSYIINLLGTPFSLAETVNREAAMLAFYRLHRSQGLSESGAYLQARDSMYDAHFPYGKYNYPELVRAKGLLGQTGHLLSTFRSYTIMYVSTVLDSFRGNDGKVSWKNADVFFGSVAILTMLGGITAPWIDDLMDVYERMTGRPLRSQIRERFRKIGGERMAWAGMHGIPALLGIDITGSLKIGIPFIGAGGIESDIIGAYGGVEQKLGKGLEAFNLGDYYRALEEWSPTFISNALKSIREVRHGATTVDGVKITDPEMNQYKPNAPEAVLQALGFRVERRAGLTEEGRTYTNTMTAIAKQRDAIYAKARLADTDAKWNSLMKDVDDYNDNATKFDGAVPFIRQPNLKRAVEGKLDKKRLIYHLLFNAPEDNEILEKAEEE